MKKNYLKNWLKKKSPGETILEVIVALLVIAMGAATASGLIMTAISANVFNKDSLIALNMAQEGLEFMRNLRDSNWLTYSYDTKRCWNMSLSTGTCAAPYNLLITEAYPGSAKQGYSLGLTSDPTKSALSTPIALKLDLSPATLSDNAPYLISYWDNTAADTDGDGNPTNDKDTMASAPVDGGTVGEPTKYYRSIEVKYKIIGPTAPWNLADVAVAPFEQNADIMIVTSRVQWLDSSIKHEVSLSSALSRYK